MDAITIARPAKADQVRAALARAGMKSDWPAEPEDTGGVFINVDVGVGALNSPRDTGASPGVTPAIPGPADREQFFAAQARNRRAAWRISALTAFTVALMGPPMSAVTSPLMYAALFVLNDLVALAFPTAGVRRRRTPVPVPHWSLHVWRWKDNPSGQFAAFNPDVSCP